MRVVALVFLLAACAGVKRQPVSEYLGSGTSRREFYVASADEARKLISQKKRFLELLLESVRSAPHIGAPLPCLDSQKIFGPFNNGLRLDALIYTSSPTNLGLPAGTCLNTGNRLSSILYAYCPALGAVVEVQIREGVITNYQRLDLCN